MFNKNYITGKFAGFFSITGNFILFIIKLWAGIISGSVALIADAWHTIADSISSVILLVGLYVSSKPPDKDHPYGHGRAEIITTFFIGILLVLVALNFMHDSVTNIINKVPVEFGTFAIVATSISLVGKEIMARVSFTASKNENNRSTEADGWHHRSDAFTSGIILIGILLEKYLWWIDGALGIFVSATILILAYRIIKDSINTMLGEKPNEELIAMIKKLSNETYHEDLYLHHFHMHRYGNHTELTFHIKLPGDFNIKQANSITDELRYKIKNELDIFATIYIDAYNKNNAN